MLRTFVRDRGRKRAFWHVLLHVLYAGYTVSSGTSGPGEQQVVERDSEEAARAEVERLVAEKLTEGYVETTAEPLHGGFDSPLRQALEQALAEGPDDLATHAAYADHLGELGDPR